MDDRGNVVLLFTLVLLVGFAPQATPMQEDAEQGRSDTVGDDLIDGHHEGDGPEEALAWSIEKATEIQSAHGGSPDEAFAGEAGSERPSDALTELVERHGIELVQGEAEQVRTLDRLDGPLASALASFVNAFLAYEEAATHTYGEVSAEYLEEAPSRPMDSPRLVPLPNPFPTLAGSETDRAPLLQERTRLLDTVRHLRVALEMQPTDTSCDRIQMPPVFSLSIGECDDTYHQDLALIIDAGGNDTYRNNAGGNGVEVSSEGCLFDELAPAAALVDLGHGQDTYGNPDDPGRCAVNGGAVLGAGFLVDEGGDDLYIADSSGVNGGGSVGGSGFLLDVGGNDIYEANGVGSNGGGGFAGHGFLFDRTGDDIYRAGTFGTNGGAAWRSTGTLFDGDGSDVYEASAIGVNGGVFAAADGTLIDVGGDDRYAAEFCGVNGGGIDQACPLTELAEPGHGLLLDGGGRDQYGDEIEGECWDCSHLPKGLLGSQVDLDRRR